MTLAERACDIADNVLFPAALEVDAAARVPAEHLDLLAAEGFYGAAADPDVEFADLAATVEALASGDLATTLVWIQHLTPVMALLGGGSPLADAWLPALVAGQRRGGIALAGIRPPKNFLRVRHSGSDFVLDGTVPWVTGWGMIDVLYVAARDADDVVHFLLMDAPDVPASGDTVAPTLRTETQRLVALQASNTVNVTFDGHLVPGDRLVSTTPFNEWKSGDSGGSALNGFLALGVVRRCAALLRGGPGENDGIALAASADACRSGLLAADAAGTPLARAAASELAWRAAATLTAWQGARSVLRTNQAQRLVREATFTMVFGSRPAIRDVLLDRLGHRA
ncbi:MAG TPA: acyl-CoA dehydrogenase family protein [Micromonosporaceae bacterium]|nr:acyl-CoA dehydrogenase family protein [Micromonosporaceae bacterium]